VFWSNLVSGKCARGRGEGRECDGVPGLEIRWRLERLDRNWKESDFCGDCCANCIVIWNITN
jgi:hypothetical protein